MPKLKKRAALALAAAILAGSSAWADDHLFNGATSAGADNRGFANPVAHNPSGRAGAMAQPASVPGLGNPNAGADQGTPAFNPDALAERLESKAKGHGG